MTSEKTGNKDMDNIIGEILACEQEIKRARNGLDTRRVGFMRYFWPFLIVSIAIVLNVVINADLADILIWSGLEAEAALRRSYNEFAIVVLIVVIIAGIIIAAHCRNKKNYSLEEDELNKRAVIRKNERKLVELYRKASTDEKKTVMSILKGEKDTTNEMISALLDGSKKPADIVSSILGSAVESFAKKK